MRDFLITGILLVALPFAVRFTWVAVLLWTWISVMNPHKLAYGYIHSAPIAAVAAGAALVSLFFNRDRMTLPKNPAVIVLVLFVIWMCVTTIFAIDFGTSWIQLSKVLKIQIMTLVAMIALRSRKHIEFFIWINVISIGFYGFKGGLFTIATGGAGMVNGPRGGFIEGNNEIALALIIVIPMINYLRLVTPHKLMRLSLLILMLLSALAAIGTQSRGAFLAIAAMGLVLWIRSSRKVAVGISLIVVAFSFIAFMPSSWEERMSTIQAYEQDSSAMGRINAWRMTYNLASSRFSGGGFEIYTPELFAKFAPNPIDLHVAHSIYFSVLGEHGFIGLLLFILLWWLALRTGGQIRRIAILRNETQWAHHLAGMCQVSLIGYAVGGGFLSLAYFDLPYNILVVMVVSLRWLQEKQWETDSEGAFGARAVVSLFPAENRKGWKS